MYLHGVHRDCCSFILYSVSRYSAVGTAFRLRGGKLSNCDSIHGRDERFFAFAKPSRLVLRLNQPRAQWIQRFLSPGVKWALCEAVLSFRSNTEVSNVWSYSSISPVSFHGQHRDTFAFLLHLTFSWRQHSFSKTSPTVP